MPVTTLVVHEDVPLDSVGLAFEGRTMNRIRISEGMGLDDFGLQLDAVDGDLGKFKIKKVVQKVKGGMLFPKPLRRKHLGWKKARPAWQVPAVQRAMPDWMPGGFPITAAQAVVARAAAVVPAPSVVQGFGGFEDDGSTPLVTIDEDASLEDLDTYEHLSYLDSMGQLDDLGKFKLKKITQKIKKVVQKVVPKAIRKVVKKAGQAVKKVVKTVARATPGYMLLKAAKGVVARKMAPKGGGGEEVVYEQGPPEPPPPGMTAATWNVMTVEQQQAYYDKLTAQEQAAYDAQQATYDQQAAYDQQSAQQPVSVPAGLTPAQQQAYVQQVMAARAATAAGGGGGAPITEEYQEYPEEGGGEAAPEEGGGEAAPEEGGGGDGGEEGGAAVPGLPGVKMLTEGGQAAAPAGGKPAGEGTSPWVHVVVVGGVLALGAVIYFAFIKK